MKFQANSCMWGLFFRGAEAVFHGPRCHGAKGERKLSHKYRERVSAAASLLADSPEHESKEGRKEKKEKI